MQARSISLLLEHELQAIDSNLKSVVNSSLAQKPDAFSLVLDSLQHTTQDITDFYFYIGPNGNLVSKSNIVTPVNLDKIDFSNERYFTEPKNRNSIIFGELDTSFDKLLRFYISYPVFTELNGSKKFNGVVTAAVGPDIAISFFKTRFPPEFERNEILIVDKVGNILYSTDQHLAGKSTHNPNTQEQMKIIPYINNFIDRDSNSSKIAGFISSDKDQTIVGEPVVLSDNSFLTTFVRAQNYLTADMNELYNNQNTFSAIAGVIIGAIAIICTIVLLSWNKRLSIAVKTKTDELGRVNQSLKESNERLADANAKLSAANSQLSIHDKMQNEFINVASHEIKTPTQAILFYSDLLQVIPERDPAAVEAIAKNAYRLQRLTSDILDVTRIESSTLKLNKKRFDLCQIIAQIIEDYQSRIDSGKLQLVFEPCNFEVYADKERLIQVISNIVDNAIKFTEEGLISVTVIPTNHYVTVSIRDTGRGIDPAIRPLLFTKFASRSDNGTGLGLYISKSVIEAHGGTLSAEDVVRPTGSIFTFRLPVGQKE